MIWAEQLNGAEKFAKIEEGLGIVQVPREKTVLNKFLQIKQNEERNRNHVKVAQKHSKKDVLYWMDIKKFNVGIYRPQELWSNISKNLCTEIS